MALLDFMKQGTQWMTDNTGMDWNSVQRDPGLAAKRLMGGNVSPYQPQSQQTQANLLDAPQEIVVNPAMQNRQTFIPTTEQVQPDMSAVNQYSNFNYEPTPNTDFYDKAANEATRTDGIRLSEGGAKLTGASSQANAPVIPYDYATRANAPMYSSNLMGQAQDMSLQNAADDITMVKKPTTKEKDLTILPELAYENTPYEANQELAKIKPVVYTNETPIDDKKGKDFWGNDVTKNTNKIDNRIRLTQQQDYTVKMIMNNPNTSPEEKTLLLEQYGINPETYLVPGYEKGALVSGLISPTGK